MRFLLVPLGLLLLGAFVIDGTTWDWLGYVLVGAGAFLLVAFASLVAFVGVMFIKNGKDFVDKMDEEYFTNFGRKVKKPA